MLSGDRWSGPKEIGGVPWNTSKDDPEADGFMPDEMKEALREEARQKEEPKDKVEERHWTPRAG